MKLKTLSILASILLLAPLAASAQVSIWNVDPSHSGVKFSVRHFFTQVPGRFGDFEGEIRYDPETPSKSSVSFAVQAASIDTDNERRDGHLKSPDFFDVENHSTLSFSSTSVKSAGDGKLEVTGDFTLHGVTKTVTVPVEFLGMMETEMGAIGGFHTEFTIDRQDYGVKWNRALDNGGAVLGDEVKISIDIEARRAEPEKKEEG